MISCIRQTLHLAVVINSFNKMPSIRDLKTRDRRQAEIRLYMFPWVNADEEKENKRVYFLNKVNEYMIWCKNKELEPELEKELKEAYDKANKSNLL